MIMRSHTGKFSPAVVNICVPDQLGVKGKPESPRYPNPAMILSLGWRNDVKKSKPPTKIKAIPQAKLAFEFPITAEAVASDAIPTIQYGRPASSSDANIHNPAPANETNAHPANM